MHASIRRHPVTRHFARSVAETRDDPYAWWEGTAEPQRVAGVQPWQPHRTHRRRARLAAALLVVALLLVGGLL